MDGTGILALRIRSPSYRTYNSHKTYVMLMLEMAILVSYKKLRIFGRFWRGYTRYKYFTFAHMRSRQSLCNFDDSESLRIVAS